jgi:hypothetical protein
MTPHLEQPSTLGITPTGEHFAISAAARMRHLHFVGQTGAGKSNALLHLIAQHLLAGAGVALLDPHGDLAEQALAFVPKKRAHELVYLNPADLERPIGFNVLERVPIDLRALTCDGIVAAFVHIWGETSVGARSQQVLRNCLRALMDAPAATLLCIPRLLTDDLYRERVVRSVHDPVVRAYWRNEFAGYDAKYRSEATAPLLNKLDALLSVPALRNIIAQPKSSIDIRRMMDESRILIANLSKGAIGEGTSHLLGALITTTLARAALSRADTIVADRKPFHLYADEFQSFATDSFAVILSEARKYALSLTLGHQYLEQLPPRLKHAVLGNTGSFVSFRVGVEDAPLLAFHLGIDNPDALTDLPNFTAWARTLIDGTPSSPRRIDLYSPPRALHDSTHRLAANSRIRFGRPRRQIEARINRFLAAA